MENNDTCMRLISEAKNYHLLPERRDIVPFVTHARCKAHSTMIYVVGGEIHNRVFNSVRRFNFETKEWDEVAGMNKHRDGVGVAVYSGLIYAAGGKLNVEGSCCNDGSMTLAFHQCEPKARSTSPSPMRQGTGEGIKCLEHLPSIVRPTIMDKFIGTVQRFIFQITFITYSGFLYNLLPPIQCCLGEMKGK